MVLHIGRVDLQCHGKAIDIDHRMALAALDRLAGIEAPWTANFGRLHAPAVNYRSLVLASCPLRSRFSMTKS